MPKIERLTAAVLVKPEGGEPGSEPEARNLKEWTVAPARLRAAMRAFEKAGFHAGDLGINNFTIEAPAALFEEFFAVKVKVKEGGYGLCVLAESERTELPLRHLPAELRGLLVGVSFFPEPEFGPSNFR